MAVYYSQITVYSTLSFLFLTFYDVHSHHTGVVMSFLVKERTQLTRLRDRTDFSAHLIIWALAAAHLILAIATPPKANSPALGDSHQSPSATSSSGADKLMCI